ncbi:MAG TPA: hypothetical protein VGB00_07640 [Pyrinomonadaceae bacterium]
MSGKAIYLEDEKKIKEAILYIEFCLKSSSHSISMIWGLQAIALDESEFPDFSGDISEARK